MSRYDDTDRGPSAPAKPWRERTVENAEVAEPGPALACMLPDLRRISTLLGGTDAMREAGREYLPQHPYEPNDKYDGRLAVAFLDNYTLRTLNQLVGKAMKAPPSPGEDMPEPIVELLDDVDDAGTGLVPFARGWFRKGVEQAVCHLLVDMPAPAPREDGAPRTLADDARDGMRPTWRLITAEDMLDLQEGKVRGPDGRVKVLPTVVRFRDDEVRPVGPFKAELVQRVKVLRQEVGGVTWEAWELQKGPRGGKPKWVMVDPPAPFGLPTIPLVSFYTNKTGCGEGRPELSDLAHMNVRHWQSTADQINILTVVRFPLLAASGVRDAEGEGGGGQLVVGPNKFITTPDPQSKVYYVEHTGAAVDSGTGELERLERAMSAYGAQFMERGTAGPETASGRVIDEADELSQLQAWGLDFKDCLELACWYTAQWLKLGEDADTPIDFSVEGPVDMANDAELNFLTALRAKGDISRQAILDEAKRREVLPEDFDIEADADRIASEPPPPGTGLDGMAGGLSGAKGPSKQPQPGAKPPPK